MGDYEVLKGGEFDEISQSGTFELMDGAPGEITGPGGVRPTIVVKCEHPAAIASPVTVVSALVRIHDSRTDLTGARSSASLRVDTTVS